MAALGLICVFASGSCWAQQSTSSTNTPQKTHAKAAAKPAAKVKSSQQAQKSPSKADKSAKGGKQVATKDTKSHAADKPTDTPSTANAKPDTKVADQKSDAKTDPKVDAKPDVRAEASPPPGTMMGAYGQSLMRSPGAATATAATVVAAGTAATLAAAQPAPAAQTGTQNASLPATAMMGAAAGNAGDSVARFLQSRGIVAQAQAATTQTPQADAPVNASTNPGLLNQVRDKASDLVLSAMNFLGVPYKRGGNSVSNGFDCSGFTRHIFEMSVGLVLPRRADEQAKMSSLVPIRKEDLKPGDLVFFNTMRQTFSHVGIYVGEGKFIHSPRVGGAVRVEDMREAYWAKRFTGARRADLNQANPG
ncbi:C40 family peptidase [Roseateles chitosanitabidus]|uniref:C40 family peptidase n=1 Tax=Roseateles chitosanitabidus TaxID=65048 RepID=UPI000B16BF3C